MAKPISEDTWQKILHKHIVDGVGVRALEKEYGVSESTIRSRAKTAQIAQVKDLANQAVDVSRKFQEMDSFAQNLTASLACKLNTISMIAVDVAESEAKSARQLSALKSIQVMELAGQSDPTPEKLMMVKMFGEAVNDSMKPTFNLLNANKATIEKNNAASEKPVQKYDKIERVIVRAKNGCTTN